MHDDSHPSPDARDVGPTVLDHIRPTVVVRRRVWEPPPDMRPTAAVEPDKARVTHGADEPPPSSIFLPEEMDVRGPFGPDSFDPDSLGPDSLGPDSVEAAEAAEPAPPAPEPEVVEAAPETLRTPEVAEPEPVPSSPPRSLRVVPPRPRTVRVENTISVAALARTLGCTEPEIVGELVANGFFEIDTRAKLSREAARVAARAFGWEVDPPEPVAPPAEDSGLTLLVRPSRRRAAAKVERHAAAKKKTAAKPAARRAAPHAKAKPAKTKKTTRRAA